MCHWLRDITLDLSSNTLIHVEGVPKRSTTRVLAIPHHIPSQACNINLQVVQCAWRQDHLRPALWGLPYIFHSLSIRDIRIIL